MNILSNAHQAIKVVARYGLKTWGGKKAGSDYGRHKNSGKGIPRGTMDKICDPFFTTKAPRHRHCLGLSISYGIIQENMGGDIKVPKNVKGWRELKFTVRVLWDGLVGKSNLS